MTNSFFEELYLSRFRFSMLSDTVAIICLTLFFVWVFAPQILLGMWQVESSGATLLLARRAGALFLGFAVMLFLARNTPKSATRNAITTGLSVGCAALAIFGCYDFFMGHAGAFILMAAAVEVAIAVLLGKAGQFE